MYDVTVIGGGSGGYAAAIRAAQLGATVGLIECAETGGTCVNRGCIPSKVWLRAASFLDNLKTGKDFGVNASLESIDFKTLVERKNGVAAEIRMGMEALLQNNGVEVIRGRAALKSPREVDVDGQVVETRKIIIATGGSLSTPDTPGLKEFAMTTDDVLEMTAVPASILVCGGGYIEVEMAYLMAAFGAKVSVAPEGPRILPREDSDTSQRIAQALRDQGIEIIPRASLMSVQASGGKDVVCQLSGPKESSVTVQKNSGLQARSQHGRHEPGIPRRPTERRPGRSGQRSVGKLGFRHLRHRRRRGRVDAQPRGVFHGGVCQ